MASKLFNLVDIDAQFRVNQFVDDKNLNRWRGDKLPVRAIFRPQSSPGNLFNLSVDRFASSGKDNLDSVIYYPNDVRFSQNSKLPVLSLTLSNLSTLTMKIDDKTTSFTVGEIFGPNLGNEDYKQFFGGQDGSITFTILNDARAIVMSHHDRMFAKTKIQNVCTYINESSCKCSSYKSSCPERTTKS